MKPDLHRLLRRLTADKKRLSLMLGLLGVLGVLWGRLLLARGPETAAASPAAAAAAAAAAGASERAASRSVVYADLPAALRRDPFALDPKVFPLPGGGLPTVTSPEKSLPLPVDVTTEAAAQAMLVRQAAASLKLQTTIVGERPRAMINGCLVAVGEEIAGFTVREVNSRHVVLERDGVQVRLEM